MGGPSTLCAACRSQLTQSLPPPPPRPPHTHSAHIHAPPEEGCLCPALRATTHRRPPARPVWRPAHRGPAWRRPHPRSAGPGRDRTTAGTTRLQRARGAGQHLRKWCGRIRFQECRHDEGLNAAVRTNALIHSLASSLNHSSRPPYALSNQPLTHARVLKMLRPGHHRLVGGGAGGGSLHAVE